MEELVSSEDPEVRLFVLEVLGESTDPEALRILVETLVDEGYVADELTGIEKLQALDLGLLIWVLLNYEEPVIRVAAADALGGLGDLGALDALSQALASDLVPEVRAAAAGALAELGDALASVPLAQALESDGDGMVRAAAAQALGEIKAPGTVEVLIKALGADPDERVRAAAAWGLGQIREEAALAPLLEAEKHDDLRAVREAARDALSAWPAFSLIAALQTSSLPETRAAAAEILGRFGHASAIPALSGALADREKAVRGAALEALRRLGTMLPLENGGALLFRGQTQMAFIPGATAGAASEGPVRAAFHVEGSARTPLLRTATGDHYEDGGWIPERSIGQPHRSLGQVFDYSRALAQPGQGPRTLVSVLLSMPDSMTLIGGTVPTSSQLSFMSIPGVFWPASAVYTIRTSTARDYNWTSWIHDYSAEELEASRTVPSELHTSLPDDLPQRVRDLAVEITAGHFGPLPQGRGNRGILEGELPLCAGRRYPGGATGGARSRRLVPVRERDRHQRQLQQRVRAAGAVRRYSGPGGVGLGDCADSRQPGSLLRPSPPVGGGALRRPRMDCLRPYARRRSITRHRAAWLVRPRGQGGRDQGAARSARERGRSGKRGRTRAAGRFPGIPLRETSAAIGRGLDRHCAAAGRGPRLVLRRSAPVPERRAGEIRRTGVRRYGRLLYQPGIVDGASLDLRSGVARTRILRIGQVDGSAFK